MAGAGHSIDCLGYEQTISRLETYCNSLNVPYMTVWQGSILKFGEYGDNMSANKDAIVTNLQALAQSGTIGQYSIRFHPALDKDGYITNKTQYIGCFDFKLNEVHYTPKGNVAGTDSPVMQQILLLLTKQDERLTALEEEALEEEIQEVPEEDDIIGKINRISGVIEGNATFSGLFEDLRFGVRHLMKKAGVDFSNQVPGQKVAGTTNFNVAMDAREKVTEGLKVLLPIFPELPDILAKLAEVAQTDKTDFEFYRKKLVESYHKM